MRATLSVIILLELTFVSALHMALMKRNGEGAAEWLNISLQLQWFRAAIKQLT
jgi:hypothetical protein